VVIHRRRDRDAWVAMCQNVIDLDPFLRASHAHKCKCGRWTTGVGKSYCPRCALGHYKFLEAEGLLKSYRG
jgi:hypothetical protein